MTQPGSGGNQSLIFIRTLVMVYLLAAWLGVLFFDNNWSFLHLYHIPLWYGLLWSVLVISVLLWPSLPQKIFESLSRSRTKLLLAAAGLLALLLVFQFNSFVHGAGNMRIAQIAQVNLIIHRWFEMGISIMVAFLYSLYAIIAEKETAAALQAWKTFAFASTLASLAGAWLLSSVLTSAKDKRLLLTLVIFCGPQAILMLGPVAVEPIIPAVTIWWAYFAVGFIKRRKLILLLPLWALTLAGPFFFYALAYLIPATLYVSATGNNSKSAWLSNFLAASGLVGLIALAYYYSSLNFEFSYNLLFLEGKNPHRSYGLFSLRHLGDYFQLLWLASPLLIFAAYLYRTNSRAGEKDRSLAAVIWLALSGLVLLFIFDPVNSIVMDFPRLVAYLTPIAILLAVLLGQIMATNKTSSTVVVMVATVSVLLPFGYAPVYTVIANTDSFVTNYLEKHIAFYREACFSFRDAYFYRGEAGSYTSQADVWEQRVKIKSPEYLQLRGVIEFAQSKDRSVAVNELFQMTTRYPYWVEPKAILAKLQIQFRQFERAAELIKQCRALKPYDPEYRKLEYIYYRDIQDYPRAIATIDTLLEMLPGDLEILTDKMIISYRSRDYQTADSLGEYIMEKNPSRPYPYLIRGFIQEVKDNPGGAIYYFENLIKIDKDEADQFRVPQRLDSLRSLVNK